MNHPNLFIVGAAKAGTTTLWEVLKRHPAIFMPREERFKEPAYFSVKGEHHGLQNYLRLFERAENQKWIGEASTAYLTDECSAARIHEFNPRAKIIILLRNPVDRAYSLYNWMVQEGYEFAATFGQALNREQERSKKEIPNWFEPEYYWNYMYFHSGLYAAQLERYLKRFGDRVLVLKFERLISDLSNGFKAIWRFLDVEELPVEKVASNQSRAVFSPVIQFILRKVLEALRRPENRNLSPHRRNVALLNQYFSVEKKLAGPVELSAEYFGNRDRVLTQITQTSASDAVSDVMASEDDQGRLLSYGLKEDPPARLSAEFKQELTQQHARGIHELQHLLKSNGIEFDVQDYLAGKSGF